MDHSADSERYDELMHSVYAAALEPANWPLVVKEVAELWRAPRALLYSFSARSGEVGFAFTHNISAREMQIYASRSARADPFVEAAQRLGLLTEGRAHLGQDLVNTQALLRTDFYRDIWQPLGIGQLCTGVVFDGTDAHKSPTALSLYRSFDDPPFTAVERDRLQRLIAHMSRSLGVMFHLRNRELQAATTVAALDALSGGAALLGSDLGIVHLNGPARVLLSAADTVGVAVRRTAAAEREFMVLAPRLQARAREFEEWLSRAADVRMADDVAHFSNAFVLTGAQGEPRCVLHAAPLPASGAWHVGGDAPRIIVFLYDLTRVNLSTVALCDLFGLTRAEARAALEVLAGGSAAEMAMRLQVSVNTFKTQLAAVYAKTSTHRQVDLLKLLLALSPP